MRRTFLRTISAVLAIGTGLSAPTMAQELRMAIWSANDAHLALFNAIGDEFEASHPGVTITYDSLAFDGYTTTLTTQIAGGNPPDLAWIFDSSALDFMAAGALFPLTDTFANTEGYDIADYPPATLTSWSRDGVQYLYPFSTSPFGIFVNNDMIREAGAKTPAELIAAGEWNWDNAIGTAAATAAATGKQGLIVRDFEYKVWGNLAAIYLGWGAQPWSDDAETCTFNAPEMVEAMTFIHDAIFEKKALPGPGVSADFFAGDGAMTITQISRASLLPKDDAFEWDLVPLPSGPVGEYGWVGRAGIGVLASGKNPQLAADFLAFFSSKANVEKLAQFFPPARQSLLTTEVLAKANPLLSPEQIEAVVIRGIATGQSAPQVANFAQLDQTVRAALDAMWQPDADVAAALQTVCDRVNPLLAAN